jgi:L-fuculokinase
VKEPFLSFRRKLKKGSFTSFRMTKNIIPTFSIMQSVIAIFDIGKTNKKLFLIDEQYRIVLEKTETFAETTDEDGEDCEDLAKLTDWVLTSFQCVLEDTTYDIKAVNFSAYGASFVHLNTEGVSITSLYNYLKPLSEVLKKQFYEDNGGEAAFSRLSASPVLGNLNSGMKSLKCLMIFNIHFICLNI